MDRRASQNVGQKWLGYSHVAVFIKISELGYSNSTLTKPHEMINLTAIIEDYSCK